MPSWITLAVLALVGGCVLPPPPPPPMTYLGPLNSEPWVSTQSPPAPYAGGSDRTPFQTPNSLPPGAYNLPWF